MGGYKLVLEKAEEPEIKLPTSAGSWKKHPGDLPDPGIEPMSPALAGGFFTTEPPGKPNLPLGLRGW